MSDQAPLGEALSRLAVDQGLVGYGVSSIEPFLGVRSEMARRVEDGTAGRQRFTYTDVEVATEPERSFPWARSLIVGSATYLPAAGSPGPARPNSGRIARFATGDHYAPLRSALEAIADHLRSAGYRAEVLSDDNRLVDRASAVRAGVAWWGKSTMALAPKYGPWLLLGSVVTDVALPESAPMARDCGTCVACIPACPTGALNDEGRLDATKCISYWAQTPGLIPLEIREQWGDRFYGCDDCLDACPPGQRWVSQAGGDGGRIDLLEVLAAPDEDLLDRHSHFYIPRRDARFLRRNALVALGHSGDAAAVPVVAGYLESSYAVLRSHAAWALGRLGGSIAVDALARAEASEADPEVQSELAVARQRAEAG
ncbi:MAG: tRNA epoxyqueuosine(34) reductase QueG [Acidimicrobiia bacterium]|nr:tRNA epoxyqueuosine(34) reductase QueG [Acidimicrobiia bacterium]